MMPSRRFVRFLVLIAAFMALFWILRKIGFSQIASSFQQVGFFGALCLLLAGGVEAAFDALALREAALNRLPFWRSLLINQTGAFLNMAAPIEAGEALKATLLTRHTKGGAATAVLVWNMAARLAKSLVILTATTLALLSLTALHRQSLICWAFALLNVGIYILLAFVFRRGGVGRVLRFLTRLPFLKGERVRAVIMHVEEAERKTAQFCHKHPGHYSAILACQFCARVTGLMTMWLALSLMGTGHPFLLCVLVFSAMELAGYVVAILPTRVGILEGAAYLIFNFLGLGGGVGTILQLVLRLKQLVVTGSIVLLGWLGKKNI